MIYLYAYFRKLPAYWNNIAALTDGEPSRQYRIFTENTKSYFLWPVADDECQASICERALAFCPANRLGIAIPGAECWGTGGQYTRKR